MAERNQRGWHCAKVKGHAELKIEKHRVKSFSSDVPNLHHSKLEGHTRPHCALNLVRVVVVVFYY